MIDEGAANIGMAVGPEVRRIVLLNDPAFLGDSSRWPNRNSFLDMTKPTIAGLVSGEVLKPVDVEKEGDDATFIHSNEVITSIVRWRGLTCRRGGSVEVLFV